MDKNRNVPNSFSSLTFFAGLCIGLSPVASAIAAENNDKKSDDTLVVEAAQPSLYAPQKSADAKFSRPVA
ncbi:MAG TPA: TonB-dependent receptor, partial [Leclercia sp.]|nr:TonB-dependent receptor [Leclercia sp.]